ncbi:MAG: hypothetical protein V4805_10020 [Pseudomonadota bacterium]
MLEFLFEICCEFLLQAAVEILAELGFHSLAETFHRRPNPWLAAIGFALFGAAAGGLSLLLFPSHFVHNHTLRLVNLLVTPIAAGLMMMALGAWRARHGQDVLRIDRFFYGYLFALALAVVRFVYPQ